jgi:uncharacterized protein YbbC (DUF1343 family)
MVAVRSGLEQLLDERLDLLRGRRVGLLAHPASVDGRLRHAVELLRAAPGVRLVALFGPEHGLRGATPAEAAVADTVDPTTGLPVHSLYGARQAPEQAQLDGLDVVVVDLQDVGARFFTHYVVMVRCMRACAAAGTTVVVLDRPNPISGAVMEGPVLPDDAVDPIGLPGLPIRHGLTMGELARFFAARERLDLELTIVPISGWRRGTYFDRTGLPWVPPSPGVVSLDAALAYPGACLFEGTTANDGRGTGLPFQQVGAPGVPAEELARSLDRRLAGAAARPAWYVPSGGRHAGALCAGVQLHVLDRRVFRPVAAWLSVLVALRRLAPQAVDWALPHFDRLAGPELRGLIDAGTGAEDLVAAWRPGLKAFSEARAATLLY